MGRSRINLLLNNQMDGEENMDVEKRLMSMGRSQTMMTKKKKKKKK